MSDSFLDSNVVLYSLGNFEEKRRRSIELMSECPVISVQVLNETANILIRKFLMPMHDIQAIMKRIANECSVALLTEKTHFSALRSENSIIPESDLSFDSTAALENQFRSLLCACFPNTPVKPKYCAILSGIIKPSFLTIKKRYQFSFYDSLIIAAALEASCDVLYSEDMQHGQIIENNLKIVNPFVS